MRTFKFAQLFIKTKDGLVQETLIFHEDTDLHKFKQEAEKIKGVSVNTYETEHVAFPDEVLTALQKLVSG